MLVDAHTHLDHYDGEILETALAEIRAHRILSFSNAMDVPSYRRTLAIAERSPLIVPSFGIHPVRAVQYVDRLETLHPFIRQSPLLGEIGLDYHWVEDENTYSAQREVFEFFLAAARDQDKVVNLHTKGAETEILALLEAYDIRRAIVHWYSGPMDVFAALVERGVFFTIGVEVLHSESIRSFARRLPPGQLLTETDNPSGLEWLTGTLGMPRHIVDVVTEIARIRETTPGTIVEIVQRNFATLLPDHELFQDTRQA